MAGVLQVNIVAADHEVWSGEAKMVIAPTTEGERGFLAGHIPTLAILREGQIRVTRPDGSLVAADAQDGFLSVDNNVVQIVAGTAQLVSQ